MVDRTYNANKLTDQELTKELIRLAEYYWDYWDLEKLELVKPNTAAIMYEAAERLKNKTQPEQKICSCYRPNMYNDNINRCFGTKEFDPCNCDGNKNKCDYYN